MLKLLKNFVKKELFARKAKIQLPPSVSAMQREGEVLNAAEDGDKPAQMQSQE